MKNIKTITLLIVLIILPISCSKKEKDVAEGNVVVAVEVEKDSSFIFEIDTTLFDDDLEKGYLSINDMPPFNECTLVGTTSYKKDYNIDIFMLPSSDSAYIVMSEMFNLDAKRNPLWRMVDSIKIYFPIGTSIGWPGSVVYNDVVDYSLMALMPEDQNWIDTEVYDNLLEVWRLNIQEKKIESISPLNVSCINESFGVY